MEQRGLSGITQRECYTPISLPRTHRRPSSIMRRIAFTVTVLICTSAPLPAAGPTFERDIQPILTRFGCNAGACHGKARGQNGFQLSLLAFDNDFDFAAITGEARGRRVFPANPEFSLLLRKASGQVPHGGGKRLPEGSPAYNLVKQWVTSGCPRTPADAARIVKITITPASRLMTFNTEYQIAVTAHYSDGATEDV